MSLKLYPAYCFLLNNATTLTFDLDKQQIALCYHGNLIKCAKLYDLEAYDSVSNLPKDVSTKGYYYL
jgi:hypothetical protein